jgi:hypothetical protein
VKRIPIKAAEHIAKEYGYDQVVIIARKVTTDEVEGGEHVTTYGVNKAHCESAAMQGNALKRFMGWPDMCTRPRHADGPCNGYPRKDCPGYDPSKGDHPIDPND